MDPKMTTEMAPPTLSDVKTIFGFICPQSYKTFYGRNLLIFVLSQSVCLRQACMP
jgi:hypothetical protein